MRYNRLLTDDDRMHYGILIEKMSEVCPEMMARKISRANVQQAFVLDVVSEELKEVPGIPILCVGSFEDTASEYLGRTGVSLVNIDSDINVDLHTYANKTDIKFGIIFSTSVIEHVQDDTQFIKDICKLLKPEGLAVLTCDFNDTYKDGDKLPYSDVRFYTEKDLKYRFGKILITNNCELVDCPDWSGSPDFTHDGCDYSFATLVFRKEAE
jgi:SAM-dependent methyltransferase